MKFIIIILMLIQGCSSGGSTDEPSRQLTRVAFFGNSITANAPAPDYGWHGYWGMAASMESLDFVNQAANMLGAIEFEKFFAADWEREVNTYDVSKFKAITDYGADLVVANIGENISNTNTVDDVKRHLLTLMNYIHDHSGSELIIVNSFYFSTVANTAIAEFCLEQGLVMVDISDMGVNPKYNSLELFDDPGIGSHPSDAGMLEIANRVVNAINDL